MVCNTATHRLAGQGEACGAPRLVQQASWAAGRGAQRCATCGAYREVDRCVNCENRATATQLADALQLGTGERDALLRFVDLLTPMTSHLPAEQRAQSLLSTLGYSILAQAAGPSARARIIRALATHYSPSEPDALLDAARQLPPDDSLPTLLEVAAASGDPELVSRIRDETLSTYATLPNNYYRTRALRGLAPHLPPAELTQVVEQELELAAITNDPSCVERVAPYLTPETAGQAVQTARGLTEPRQQMVALVALLPAVEPTDRESLVRDVINIAEANAGHLRIEASAALPHLQDVTDLGLAVRAVAAAADFSENRNKAVAGLLPRLSDEQQVRLLETVPEAWGQGVGVADLLGEPAKDHLLTKVLEQPGSLSLDYFRKLLPYLSSSQQERCLAYVRDLATRNHSYQLEYRAAVARILPHDEAAAVFRECVSTGRFEEAVVDVGPYVPPELLREGLTTLRAHSSGDRKATVLFNIACAVPADMRETLWDIAGSVLSSKREMAFTAVAGVQEGRVPSRALQQIVQGGRGHQARAGVVAAMLSHLGPEDQAEVVQLVAQLSRGDKNARPWFAWLPQDERLSADALAVVEANTDVWGTT